MEQGGELVIQERLRACAVFASHNVGQDPPFPRLDLISCRNTLIYFTAPMQERVLRFFRFSLQPGALLFVGTSESLAARSPGFETLDGDHHIYRRAPEGIERRRTALPVRNHRPLGPVIPLGRALLAHESVPEQHTALLTALVRSFCPPSLILDDDHHVLEVIGDVSPYCRLPEGRLSPSVHAFLSAELQSEARALFLRARADGAAVRGSSLRLKEADTPLHLEVRPLQAGGHRMTVLAFVLEPRDAAGLAETVPPPCRDPGFDSEIERLEKELLVSESSLRRSMAELEAAYEELEASAEELQASSEELQSSNEELESSNEELLATNEELANLNQQLRARSDELQILSNDLENIQTSLNQGMVIVDRELCITRFTPLAVRVFALMEADIGHPLLGVPTTVPIPGLQEALAAVVAGEPRRNLEAASDELAYLVQIMPYLERDGRRRGAIVTLTDVAALLVPRRAAEASLDAFTRLADALPEALWKRDAAMQHLLYVSNRFQALTGWTPAELCANAGHLDDAIDEADRDRVRDGRDAREQGWCIRYGLRTREGRRIQVEERATVVREASGTVVVGTLRALDGPEHGA